MSYARNLARISRKGVITVNTAQELRDLTIYGGIYPETVETLGCLAAGDGGGGLWRWDATSPDTDDLGTVLLPTGGTGAGRWKRETDYLTPQMFGADDTGGNDCAGALIAMLASAKQQGLPIRFLKGTFLTSSYTQAASYGHVLLLDDHDISIEICPEATIRNRADASLFRISPPSGDPIAQTVYSINETDVPPGSEKVTLATPGDAANFQVGDWACVRCGQTVGVGQPLGEYIKIQEINGATLVFAGATIGRYNATIAGAGDFGISNVQDCLLERFQLFGGGTIDHTIPGNTANGLLIPVLTGTALVDSRIENLWVETNTNIWSFGSSHSSFRNISVKQTGACRANIVINDKCNTHVFWDTIIADCVGMPRMHLHEGSQAIVNNVIATARNDGSHDIAASTSTSAISLVSYPRNCVVSNVDVSITKNSAAAALTVRDATDCALRNVRIKAKDGVLTKANIGVMAQVNSIDTDKISLFPTSFAEILNWSDSGYVKFLGVNELTPVTNSATPTLVAFQNDQHGWLMPHPASNGYADIPTLIGSVVFKDGIYNPRMAFLVANATGASSGDVSLRGRASPIVVGAPFDSGSTGLGAILTIAADKNIVFGQQATALSSPFGTQKVEGLTFGITRLQNSFTDDLILLGVIIYRCDT